MTAETTTRANIRPLRLDELDKRAAATARVWQKLELSDTDPTKDIREAYADFRENSGSSGKVGELYTRIPLDRHDKFSSLYRKFSAAYGSAGTGDRVEKTAAIMWSQYYGWDKLGFPGLPDDQIIVRAMPVGRWSARINPRETDGKGLCFMHLYAHRMWEGANVLFSESNNLAREQQGAAQYFNLSHLDLLGYMMLSAIRLELGSLPLDHQDTTTRFLGMPTFKDQEEDLHMIPCARWNRGLRLGFFNQYGATSVNYDHGIRFSVGRGVQE
jgi:hypothetical protein